MLALLPARCGVINAEIRQTAMTRPGAKPGPRPDRRAELKNVIEPPDRRFYGVLPTNSPPLFRLITSLVKALFRGASESEMITCICLSKMTVRMAGLPNLLHLFELQLNYICQDASDCDFDINIALAY